MTHFATTHSETRAKTIDAINQKAIKAFDGKADVFEAYISRIGTKRVAANEGIKKEAVVLVGYGTYNSATSTYAMFDYMAKNMEKPIYVGNAKFLERHKSIDIIDKKAPSQKYRDGAFLSIKNPSKKFYKF